MNQTDTTSADFFERKYLADVDPWKFATSQYEQFRYLMILRAISVRRYEHAFEPGCSIGELTIRLAPVCRRLTACEISPTAAEIARARCQKHSNVAVVCAAVPEFIPQGTLDLIVLSEIAYYLDVEQLRLFGNRLANTLGEGGMFLAAHWLGFSPDHKLSGDQVHDILRTVPSLSHIDGHRHDGFRIDKWTKA